MKQTLKQQVIDLKADVATLRFTNKNLSVNLENSHNANETLKKWLEEEKAKVKNLQKESIDYPWEMIILDKDDNKTGSTILLKNEQRNIVERIANVLYDINFNPIYVVNNCRFYIHPNFKQVPF
jgi:hypothetical protein